MVLYPSDSPVVAQYDALEYIEPLALAKGSQDNQVSLKNCEPASTSNERLTLMSIHEAQRTKVNRPHDNQRFYCDGPAWCSRHGRFENQDKATEDNGLNLKDNESYDGK